MTSLWLDRSDEIQTDQFDPDAEYDDVVVGAGLTGIMTAVLLARAGRRVAVIEARQPGAVTTGNSTAKLSLLQGTVLSSLIRFHSERVAAAYGRAIGRRRAGCCATARTTGSRYSVVTPSPTPARSPGRQPCARSTT